MAEHEHAGRAWLAYHAAYLPSAKRPPKLADLMGLKERQAPAAANANIDLAMRKWRFVMAGVEAQRRTPSA